MASEAEPQAVHQTPHPHVPLRRVRSTLLVASYRVVQNLGRERDYLAALPAEHHAPITGAVAGTWVPVDVAIAHYDACEKLGLSVESQVEVGKGVGSQIRGTFFGTVMNLSKEVGVTPWSVIPSIPRLWPRLFDGSAIAISTQGPKEIRMDVTGLPLVDIPYFRNALRGQAMGMLDLFCRKTFASVYNGRFAPGSTSLRIQWA